ncbi:hypothetical protein [Rhizobium sp. KDH_Rht_773_N]
MAASGVAPKFGRIFAGESAGAPTLPRIAQYQGNQDLLLPINAATQKYSRCTWQIRLKPAPESGTFLQVSRSDDGML